VLHLLGVIVTSSKQRHELLGNGHHYLCRIFNRKVSASIAQHNSRPYSSTIQGSCPQSYNISDYRSTVIRLLIRFIEHLTGSSKIPYFSRHSSHFSKQFKNFLSILTFLADNLEVKPGLPAYLQNMSVSNKYLTKLSEKKLHKPLPRSIKRSSSVNGIALVICSISSKLVSP